MSIKEKDSAAEQPSVLTDERIGQLYLGTKHIGHATNREIAFARAVEREVTAHLARQSPAPDGEK